MPRLAAIERLAIAAALRRPVATSEDLDRAWGAVRAAAAAACERLARLDDGLDRAVTDVVRASPYS